MRLASLVNEYTSEQEPWALVKSDRERAATVLYVGLRCIDSLKILFTPFLPFSGQRLHELLGYEGEIGGPPEDVRARAGRRTDEYGVLTGDYARLVGRWEPSALPPGQQLLEPKLLFKKLDPDKVVEEELGGWTTLPAAMIDTHAHLDACSDPASAVLERARAAGVERVITVGTTIDSCRCGARARRLRGRCLRRPRHPSSRRGKP